MPGWLTRLIEREEQGFLRHLRRPTKWNAKHCPEIKHFGSEGADLHTAHGLWLRRVCGILLALVLMQPVYYGSQALFRWQIARLLPTAPLSPGQSPWQDWTLPLFFVVALFVLCTLTALIGLKIGNRFERRYLRHRLRERGVILCIPCGHDMTGTGAERCAECGKPLALRRPAREP